MSIIGMFGYIDFETVGACNRHCPTCIRNSHPDRDKIQSWFSGFQLSLNVIKEALDQCKELGFTGGVCLSHYNEPLMDDRIVDIAKLVKSYNQFHPLFLNTNGDFLKPELAERMDGVFDHIIVSPYMDEPIKSLRAEWILSLFSKTRVDIAMAPHIATHFSPSFDVESLSKNHRDRPCREPSIRVVINHRRQYLLCCDDVVGNFDLGHFPDISIKDYWFGEKRVGLSKDLQIRGGRHLYDYCSSCPRP